VFEFRRYTLWNVEGHHHRNLRLHHTKHCSRVNRAMTKAAAPGWGGLGIRPTASLAFLLVGDDLNLMNLQFV
jgi:hypothetical protein